VHALIEKTLTEAGLDADGVTRVIRAALSEDLADGPDVTTTTIVPADATATAAFVSRATGVVAGIPVAAAVIDEVSQGTASFDFDLDDGSPVRPGSRVLRAHGRTRDLLTAERTALNLLCRLSGIATATRAWADAIAGTGAAVRDTRKTTPGLRALEKYAVRRGGGVNHRMSLSDAALVKDNHVIAAGGVRAAFEAVRAARPDLPIEVEVDRLDQIPEILDAGVELILLDNFTPAQLSAAVALVAGRAKLEASGGLTLAAAREVAATGVDYLSVGALTHSAPILDLGCDFEER
jgi:nicotinate-nucleotide pyrophosphorylase (carboxylating)